MAVVVNFPVGKISFDLIYGRLLGFKIEGGGRANTVNAELIN